MGDVADPGKAPVPDAAAEPASPATPTPDPAAAHDAKVDSDEQPFLSHIIELRARLIRGLVVIAVLIVPFYVIANELYEYISAPLLAHLPEGSSMIATDVASPFLTPFKLSMLTALFVGMPFLLHQIWGFVSPGLYLHEKKFAIPLLVSSILLFYLGTAFAYFLVFPLVFQFLVSVAPAGVTMMTDISRYLDFVIKMFFAFGLAFEIPIATLLLAWTGIASAQSMVAKRPYIVVGCFVLGMLLTPPDVISQLLLAIPAWMLFEIGIVFARMVEKRNEIH